MQEKVQIIDGYTPGCIGRIAALHGTYYHEHWDFGVFFEARVATDLSAFLSSYDQQRDGFWTATLEGQVEGSIAVNSSLADTEGAHLRWFIVSNALRGKGFGNRLLDLAVDFCRGRGYGKIFLWTFEGLDAARHLYEKKGFRLVAQNRGTRWGREVNEQQMELELK